MSVTTFERIVEGIPEAFLGTSPGTITLETPLDSGIHEVKIPGGFQYFEVFLTKFLEKFLNVSLKTIHEEISEFGATER